MDVRNLAVRSASGIVYVALMVGAIFLGLPAICIFATLLAIGAVNELHSNFANEEEEPNLLWFITIDALSVIAVIWSIMLPPLLLAWFGLFFIRFVIQIFCQSKRPVQSISLSCLAQLYIALPLFSFVAIEWILEKEPWFYLALIAFIWINDTGAFLVGSLMGRHKMAPSISPKKSWEGLAGGIIVCVIFAVICHFSFVHVPDFLKWNVGLWIAVGIGICILSTLGDLFESKFKRSLGVKDSGNIIPGHGGILDRIDSLLFVTPFLFLFLLLYDAFTFGGDGAISF